MQYTQSLCSCFGNDLVHSDRFRLFSGFTYIKNAYSNVFGTKAYSDEISNLNRIRGLNDLAVYSNSGGITCIVSNTPALNKSRDLKIFV